MHALVAGTIAFCLAFVLSLSYTSIFTTIHLAVTIARILTLAPILRIVDEAIVQHLPRPVLYYKSKKRLKI